MAIPTMTEPTRSRFQFSLSTVLAVVLVVAAVLGFWLQEQRWPRRGRILAAHGLATGVARPEAGGSSCNRHRPR